MKLLIGSSSISRIFVLYYHVVCSSQGLQQVIIFFSPSMSRYCITIGAYRVGLWHLNLFKSLIILPLHVLLREQGTNIS